MREISPIAPARSANPMMISAVLDTSPVFAAPSTFVPAEVDVVVVGVGVTVVLDAP